MWRLHIILILELIHFSIFEGKVSKRMLKEVIKVCHRGQRQNMYAKDADKHNSLAGAVKSILLYTAVTPQILSEEEKVRVLYISSIQLHVRLSFCLSVCLFCSSSSLYFLISP
jgi:hypothetical protein